MRRLALAGAIGLLLLSSTSVFAATNNQVWRAPLPDYTITAVTPNVTVHGGATLALVGNGQRASIAVKLYDVKPKWTLTVNVMAGTTLISRDKFRVAGPAVHRFWLSPSEITSLKTALGATTPTLSVVVIVTAPAVGTTPGFTATLPSATFTKVTH